MIWLDDAVVLRGTERAAIDLEDGHPHLQGEASLNDLRLGAVILANGRTARVCEREVLTIKMDWKSS